MSVFNITSVGHYEGGQYVVTGYRARGYRGAGTSSIIESKTTTKEQATEWATRRTAGEAVQEAGWACYADD